MRPYDLAVCSICKPPNMTKHILICFWLQSIASPVHMCMQGTIQQQLHKQEAAISRLHQRSRGCFRLLKSGQTGHPVQQAYIPSQEGSCVAQPVVSIAQDHSADVHSLKGMQEVPMEQHGQLDGSAMELESRKRRSGSPVRGTAACIHALTHTYPHQCRLILMAQHFGLASCCEFHVDM